MSRKLKASPHRWLTASNLLVAHLIFHILFVFGYWMVIGATLSFSDLDFIENHLQAYLSNALTNHLALLLVLGFHTVVVIANRWWKQRQLGREDRQMDSELGHLTAEQKLELLLDEVVELREALHEHKVVEQADRPDLTSGRLRDHSQVDQDEMIRLEDYQAVKTRKES